MYQRALQGYEKVIGVENIMTYILALNTILNLGLFFAKENNLVKARIMYSKALAGYEKVFGLNHPKCHSLQERIQALDTLPPTGKKWYKLLRKLRLREEPISIALPSICSIYFLFLYFIKGQEEHMS